MDSSPNDTAAGTALLKLLAHSTLYHNLGCIPAAAAGRQLPCVLVDLVQLHTSHRRTSRHAVRQLLTWNACGHGW